MYLCCFPVACDFFSVHCVRGAGKAGGRVRVLAQCCVECAVNAQHRTVLYLQKKMVCVVLKARWARKGSALLLRFVLLLAGCTVGAGTVQPKCCTAPHRIEGETIVFLRKVVQCWGHPAGRVHRRAEAMRITLCPLFALFHLLCITGSETHGLAL